MMIMMMMLIMMMMMMMILMMICCRRYERGSWLSPRQVEVATEQGEISRERKG